MYSSPSFAPLRISPSLLRKEGAGVSSLEYENLNINCYYKINFT